MGYGLGATDSKRIPDLLLIAYDLLPHYRDFS